MQQFRTRKGHIYSVIPGTIDVPIAIDREIPGAYDRKKDKFYHSSDYKDDPIGKFWEYENKNENQFHIPEWRQSDKDKGIRTTYGIGDIRGMIYHISAFENYQLTLF